jgi:hypothetical protein
LISFLHCYCFFFTLEPHNRSRRSSGFSTSSRLFLPILEHHRRKIFKSQESGGVGSAVDEERPIFALDDRCQRSLPGQMNVAIPYVPDNSTYDVSRHHETYGRRISGCDYSCVLFHCDVVDLAVLFFRQLYYLLVFMIWNSPN